MSDILVVKRIWSRKVSRFYNVKVWADGNILTDSILHALSNFGVNLLELDRVMCARGGMQ